MICLWYVRWRCVLWRMYLTQMFWLLKGSIRQSFSGWEIMSLQLWPLTSWIVSVLSCWGEEGVGHPITVTGHLVKLLPIIKHGGPFISSTKDVIEQNNISSTFSRTTFFENPHHKYNLWGNQAWRFLKSR